MQVGIVSIFAFFALVGIVFMVSIVLAPAKLDAELQREAQERDQTIRTLSEKPKRAPAEEQYHNDAREILANVSAQAKRVMRHILEHEKLLAGPEYQVRAMTNDEVRSILEGELAGEPVCRIVVKRSAQMPLRTVWWEITPAYRLVLGELLYPDEN